MEDKDVNNKWDRLELLQYNNCKFHFVELKRAEMLTG